MGQTKQTLPLEMIDQSLVESIAPYIHQDLTKRLKTRLDNMRSERLREKNIKISDFF